MIALLNRRPAVALSGMPGETRLSPDEARTRFGVLVDRVTRTYSRFERPEGMWRPERDPGPRGMVLREYRLYPPVKDDHAA